MSGVHPMTFAAVSLCRPCNLPARPAAVPPPPRRLRVLCGTGLLLVLFACARGQITAYTSQSGFLTAAQAGGSLVFTDNLNSGSLSSGTATFPNGTVSGINIAFPNTNAVNTVDGSAYLRLIFSSGSVTFNFASPLTAFGFETNPRVQGVGHVINVSAGGNTASFAMPATDTTEFRGFVSAQPFSTFTLSNPGSANDFYGIDNVVAYGTAIPEPGTSAAICGVLALGVAAWRRRIGARTDR